MSLRDLREVIMNGPKQKATQDITGMKCQHDRAYDAVKPQRTSHDRLYAILLDHNSLMSLAQQAVKYHECSPAEYHVAIRLITAKTTARILTWHRRYNDR